MTENDQLFLSRINKYAEEVLGDIDPQKTHVSEQLMKLRPVMQQLAMENQMSVDDVFIKYMDLQSEATVEADKKMKDKYGLDDTMDLDIGPSKIGF